jgi:hypothetical protein
VEQVWQLELLLRGDMNAEKRSKSALVFLMAAQSLES